MENKPENPPAFSTVIPSDEKKGWDAEVIYGMTLRDYFAAKEDGAKLADYYAYQIEEVMGEKVPSGTIENIQYHFRFQSKLQYMKADAMLKERSINP